MSKKKKQKDELKILSTQLTGSAVILVLYFVTLALFYLVVRG